MKAEQWEVVEPGGSGATKRFCTIHVTISAEADQQVVKIEIYFRGQGLRLTPEERDHFAGLGNVIVRFQAKAWSDSRVSWDYLMAFRKQTLHLGEVMLGMDNHGSQISPIHRKFMELMDVVPVMTPANCTDCVSPVDRNVGQALKLKIARRYDEAFSRDREKWESPPGHGGLSASVKRMLVATWVSEAWQEFCAKNKRCITSAFIKTGFLVVKDGTENSLIELFKLKRGAPFSARMPDGGTYDF